jgi:hypothetical protein
MPDQCDFITLTVDLDVPFHVVCIDCQLIANTVARPAANQKRMMRRNVANKIQLPPVVFPAGVLQ